MTKALGTKHPGALVNAVQPLIFCEYCESSEYCFTDRYLGGRCLKKSDDQAELIQLLQQIERDTKWAISQGIQSLQEAWSFDRS